MLDQPRETPIAEQVKRQEVERALAHHALQMVIDFIDRDKSRSLNWSGIKGSFAVYYAKIVLNNAGIT